MTAAERRASLLALAADADDIPGPELIARIRAAAGPDLPADADDVFAELVDAQLIVTGLTDRSVDPAQVSDWTADPDRAIAEWERHVDDALARLGCGSTS